MYVSKFLIGVVLLGAAAMPAFAETFLVLPFFNLSGSANIQWIGESFSESVRAALASRNMIALERDAREEAYRRLSIKPGSRLTKASLLRLGEVLDADYVIFGSFELFPASDNKSKGLLSVSAQILDRRKFIQRPEAKENGPLEDLAILQSRISWRTLQSLEATGTLTEEQFRNQHPEMRVDAIESYVRGLLAASGDQQIRLFGQAVRLEPRYSQANFELGKLYWRRRNYKPAADHLEKVAPSDVHSREATFLLGLCRYHIGDFAGAEQAFLLVAQLVPLNEVWNNLGASQSRRNSSEALESFRKALEGDEKDPDYHFNLGYALFRRGDADAAAAQFRAVLDRRPDDTEAMTMLGRCLRPNPRPPTRSEGLERLKQSYEESAYLQLKAVLESKK